MQTSQAIDYHIKLDSLKGRFLAASPCINDDLFQKKIIFICETNRASAFGFIIDPIEPNNLQKNFKKEMKGTRFKNLPIYSGGPIDSNRLFLVHSDDVIWPETLNIHGDENEMNKKEIICITNLTNILNNDTPNMPKNYIIISGYTNWMQNKLSREIALGFWLFAPLENSIIFDKKIDNKWKYCMDMLKININTFYKNIGTS
jgi:putative transcriptional regulator